MMDNNKKKLNSSELEYTIVMDGSYLNTAERRETLWQAVERRENESDDNTKTLDRLYFEYEKMCMKEPNFLDKDDIYPHSYQWRLDEYDPGKVEVLKEALRTHRHIADTEAYQRYIESVSSRRFTPESWD